MNKIMALKYYAFLGLIGFTLSIHSADNPSFFNFDGMLMDGAIPMTGPVSIKVQVFGGTPTTPSTCLLYEEEHASVALDDGAFTIKIGTGTRNTNSSTGDGGTVSWKQLFSNKTGVTIRSAISGTTCTTGYTPAAFDIRYLRITVDDGTPLSPDFKISSVPFATTADTLQGHIPADFVSSKANQVDLYNTDKSNSISLKAPASFGTNITYEWPITPINNYVLSTNSSGVMSWVPQSSGLGTTGGTMTGAIAMSGNNISNVGNIDLANQKTLKLGSFSTEQESAITDTGAIWFNSNTNSLMYRDASSNKSVGTVTSIIAGSGLIGGQIISTGVLAVDSGTAANQIPKLNPTSQLALDNGSAATPTYTFSSDTDNGMFSPAPNSVAFGTLSTERMRIDETGKVGIGTTTPQVELHITGTKAIRIPAGTTGQQPSPPANGMVRYNTDKEDLEYYSGNAWRTPFAPKPPYTIPDCTYNYTVSPSDVSLIFQTTTPCLVNLPAAGTFPGRILYMKNVNNVSVNSASTNVVQQASNTISNQILATAGKFAMLQSNGTNWVIMMSN